MPSRKQRRRREKGRRHEYEYVYVDERGREVEPDEAVEEAPTPAPRKKADGVKPAAVSSRGGRVVQPPSWRRVGRRALIFAPIMFLTVSFIAKDLTTPQKLIQTLVLLAFFLPFSYLMDTMTYRTYVRRTGGGPDSGARGRR